FRSDDSGLCHRRALSVLPGGAAHLPHVRFHPATPRSPSAPRCLLLTDLVCLQAEPWCCFHQRAFGNSATPSHLLRIDLFRLLKRHPSGHAFAAHRRCRRSFRPAQDSRRRWCKLAFIKSANSSLRYLATRNRRNVLPTIISSPSFKG